MSLPYWMNSSTSKKNIYYFLYRSIHREYYATQQYSLCFPWECGRCILRLPFQVILGMLIKCICVTPTVKQLRISASLICVLVMSANSDPLYIPWSSQGENDLKWWEWLLGQPLLSLSAECRTSSVNNIWNQQHCKILHDFATDINTHLSLHFERHLFNTRHFSDHLSYIKAFSLPLSKT